jgi:hypothetical protein
MLNIRSRKNTAPVCHTGIVYLNLFPSFNRQGAPVVVSDIISVMSRPGAPFILTLPPTDGPRER